MIVEKYKRSNSIQEPEDFIIVISRWKEWEEKKSEESRNEGVNISRTGSPAREPAES